VVQYFEKIRKLAQLSDHFNDESGRLAHLHDKEEVVASNANLKGQARRIWQSFLPDDAFPSPCDHRYDHVSQIAHFDHVFPRQRPYGLGLLGTIKFA